jgi:hypothetical protein
MRSRPIHSLRCATTLLAAAAASAAVLAADAPPRPAGLTGDRVAGFIQYVRWPGEGEVRRWEVCVTSRDHAVLDADLPPARGRPIAVRTLAAGDGLERCHVADLSGLAPASARALLERARRLPVVTIGEGESFCSAGGVICTRSPGAGGGFEVNLTALQEAGLNANAQLLMLGRRRQTAGAGP